MLEKMNYKVNSKIDFKGQVINGQGMGEISKCKYGLFHASYNSCEMIALYNLLIKQGYRGYKFADICLEMYPKAWALWGILGSNVYSAHLFFKKHGIQYERFYKRDSFFEGLEQNRFGIISFWNTKSPFGGIHTVCVEKTYTGYKVYNRYNGRSYPYEYKTVDEVVDKCRFITGYTIPHNN